MSEPAQVVVSLTPAVIEAIQSLRPAADHLQSAIGMLGGVIVGGLVTYFSISRLEQRRYDAEALSVAKSLETEISVLLDTVATRGYLPQLDQQILNAEGSGTSFNAQEPLLPISDNYAQVYRSLLPKIGLLHKDYASKVVRFYQLVDNAVQTSTSSAHAPANTVEQLKSAKNNWIDAFSVAGGVIGKGAISSKVRFYALNGTDKALVSGQSGTKVVDYEARVDPLTGPKDDQKHLAKDDRPDFASEA